MEFAIATVEFWESVGFNTDNWRKSTDEKYALVHLEYAKVLVDIGNDNIQVYRINDPAFKELLSSELWSTIDGGDIDG